MSVAELGYKIDSSGAVVAAANLDDMTAAAVRAEAGAAKVATQSVKTGVAMKSSGAHVANLGAQFNDIGVMLAAGQSPLQLAVQQGTQINQVLAQMGGGKAALRGLAAGFMSMVNPMSLATIGIIAGGAALVQWAVAASGGADSAEEFKKAIEDANSAMEEYVSLAKEIDRNNGESFEAAADNVRMVSDAYRDLIAIAKIEALNSINAATVELAESVTNYSYTLGAIGDAGDLLDVETQLQGNITVWKENREEVGLFVDALNEMKNAADLSDRYEAAVRVRDIFKSTVDVSGEMNDRQLEFWKNLSNSVYQMELLGAAVKSADGDMDGLVAKARQQEYLLESANMFLDAQQRIRNENGTRMREQIKLEQKLVEEIGKAEIAILKLAGVDLKNIDDAAIRAASLAASMGIAYNEAYALANVDFAPLGGGLTPGMDNLLPTNEELTGRKPGRGGGAKVDQYAADLEALKTSLMTEREVLEQWKLEQDTLLADQRAIELLGIEEHNQAKLRLEEEYNQRRVEIAAKGEETKLSLTLGGAADVLGVIGQFNDKAFKLAKVAAAAQALISTLQGSAEALKLPYPYNLIAAAQVAAKGFGLVAAIKGVSSSGGSASISAGGTSSAAGVTATSSAAEVAPQTQTVIQLEGAMAEVVGPMLDAIIKGIQSESEDGVIITGIQTA